MTKIAGLVALLIGLGALSSLPRAEAEEVGSFVVSGTVGSEGHPVSDAHVSARRQSAAGTYDEVTVTHTDGTGAFALELIGGTYRFQVIDHDGQYVAEWYGDAPSEEASTPLVIGSEMSLDDIELGRASVLTGTVDMSSGSEAGWTLRAFEAYGDGSTVQAAAVSNDDGAIQLAVPPGYWKLQMISPSGGTHWLKGGATFASASAYRIRKDKDFGYFEFYEPGPSTPQPRLYDVTGTVAPEGRDPGDYVVDIYKETPNGFEYPSTAYLSDRDMLLPLSDGRYKIRVHVEDMLDWWYGGGGSLSTAGVLAVQGGPISLGELTLQPLYPVLVGTLRDTRGLPLVDVGVVARNVIPGGPGASDRTDERGQFVLYNKTQGDGANGSMTWKLNVGYNTTKAYPEWYRGATTALSATPIQVHGRKVIEEPWVVGLGSSITGRVTNAANQPLQQVRVTVVDSQGNERSYEPRIQTNRDGRYAVPRLLPGSYRLLFSDSYIGEYVDQWSGNQQTAQTAVPVVVGENDTAAAPDVVMAPSGYQPPGVDISGTVVGADGPVAGALVRVLTVAGSPDSASVVETAVTGHDGRYNIWRIDPATTGNPRSTFKLVVFDDQQPAGELGHVKTYLGDTTSYGSSPVLTLPPSGQLTGVDVHPVQYGGVQGTVQRDGDPQLDLVMSGAGANAPYAITDPDTGNYLLVGLTPGAHTLGAPGLSDDDDDRVIPMWWTQSATRESATPFIVQPGVISSGVDFERTDTLVNLSPPSIIGAANLGQSLTADPGVWNFAGLTYDYQWLDGEAVLTTGPVYEINNDDDGRRLTLRVTARTPDSNAPFQSNQHFLASIRTAPTSAVTTGPTPTLPSTPPPPTTPPPSTPTPGTVAPLAESRLRTSGRYLPKVDMIRLKVLVRVAGQPDPGGTLRILEDARVVRARITLREGRAVVRVRDPAPGKHIYKLKYSGTTGVLPAHSRLAIRVN